jgi:hypothetical protein
MLGSMSAICNGVFERIARTVSYGRRHPLGNEDWDATGPAVDSRVTSASLIAAPKPLADVPAAERSAPTNYCR